MLAATKWKSEQVSDRGGGGGGERERERENIKYVSDLPTTMFLPSTSPASTRSLEIASAESVKNWPNK